VGSSDGLQINLVWDSSVRSAKNWQSVEASVVAAAEVYTQYLSEHVVVNIGVGLGEVGGTKMGRSALGESESFGDFYSYSTVVSALGSADAGLVSSGQMSSDALTANGPPTDGNFFVTTAEAKALGLLQPSTSLDGYIGIAKSPVLFGSSVSIGKSLYDGEGIAAHELTEVMGRIGFEGDSLGSVSNVFTPFDLFRYSAPGVRDLSPSLGYFSLINGAEGSNNQNTLNSGFNGGDSADWDSSVLKDAYDAFGTPGVKTIVSPTDILAVAALGYGLKSLPSGNLVV
jgi:hypothetical protein